MKVRAKNNSLHCPMPWENIAKLKKASHVTMLTLCVPLPVHLRNFHSDIEKSWLLTEIRFMCSHENFSKVIGVFLKLLDVSLLNSV